MKATDITDSTHATYIAGMADIADSPRSWLTGWDRLSVMSAIFGGGTGFDAS
jgi:hypothetical protein